MGYSLKDITEGHTGEIYPVPVDGLLCGRSRIAAMRFCEPDVSGIHLHFKYSGDGELYVENMSLHRTLLNGKPILNATKTVLKAGDEIQLGEMVRMKVIEDAERGIVGAADAVTIVDDVPSQVDAEDYSSEGETVIAPESVRRALRNEERARGRLGTSSGDTAVTKEWSITNPTMARDDGDVGATMARDDGEVGATMARDDGEVSATKVREDDVPGDDSECNGTRMVTPEELENLRNQRKKGIGKRVMLYGLLLCVLGLLMAAVWFQSSVDQEAYLSWPTDNGQYNDVEVNPNSEIGGNFWVYYPNCAWLKEEKTDDGFVVESRLGKDYDVPFRLIYKEKKDVRNLTTSRAEGLERWMNAMLQNEKGWNFDKVSDVEFRGRDNGFPYQSVKYSRAVGGVSWFGVAMFFKYNEYEMVFCKEIPAKERWRGEELIMTDTCMGVSQYVIEGHWEYQGTLMDFPVQRLLDESRSMLDRTLPASWPQIMDMLVSALIKTRQSGDVENYRKADAMLRELRQKQTKWLNSQKIAYFNAQAKRLYKLSNKIRDDCRAMFSDENDQRYHFIREDQWD